MDLEMRSRVYALELLTTQLISEYLRTVPDPKAQANWARALLHESAETLRIDADGLDEEARLRIGIKEQVTRLLDAALSRALAEPRVSREWGTGPQAGA
jgi:hypothetical protein